jgi:hypothetical protein
VSLKVAQKLQTFWTEVWERSWGSFDFDSHRNWSVTRKAKGSDDT